jgi:hypothetical protein
MSDEKYTHFVGAKVTDAQFQKIKSSGLSDSDYLRNAIDFYDVTKLMSYARLRSNWIGELITLLNVWNENVKLTPENTFNEMMENVKFVKQNRGSLLNNTPLLLNELEENVKPEKNVKPEVLNKPEAIVKQDEEDAKQKAEEEAWEQVKQTLRNMTTAKGRPSHEDFRRQAKKCGRSKGWLEKYYEKHIRFFQQDCVKPVKK